MSVVVFKRVKLTANNVRLRKGEGAKVVEISASGDRVEVVFDKEPSQQEILAILRFLNQERWEVES